MSQTRRRPHFQPNQSTMANRSNPDTITAMTISSPPQEDTFLDDLLVVTIWTIILIYAFITNTLTLVGIFRSNKMRMATSYWIVASLAICDWFMIIISLFHIIPATYLHDSYVDVVSMQTIGAMFVYNVFWYSGVIQLAAMAVNRFVSIVYPLHYKRIFAPRNTLIIISALYLFGLLASVPALHHCCYIVYDHNMYVTYYWPVDSQYMWLDIFINTLSVSTMIVCYAAILIRVRKSTIRRRRYQLAAKAGQASGAVLLIAAAAAAARTYSTTTTQDDEQGQRRKASQAMKIEWANFKTKVRGSPMFQKKRSIIHADYTSQTLFINRQSVSTDGKSQSFIEYRSDSGIDRCADQPTSIDTKRPSLADHRRSLTSPNLFAACATYVQVSNNNKSITTAIAPAPSEETASSTTPLISHQKQCAALAALQRQPDQSQQATRREIRLFVQFFVVSLVFLSTWVTWQWLPRISNASKWVYFGTTTFFFINNAVNPTVYLIFNSGLRNQVKEILSCQWAKNVTRNDRVRNGKFFKTDMGSSTAKGATRNSSSSD